MTRRRGFTLIELLVVVAIIGIVAAIAIPNLVGAFNRGRQKRTMGDIRTIGLAVEAYSVEMNRYPLVASGDCYSALQAYLEPTFIRHIPVFDAWGSTYRYIGDAAAGTSYTVWSASKDGNASLQYTGGTTTNFNNDIVFSAGSFTQWPEGVQAGE